MKLLIDHWREWATAQLMALVGTGLPNRAEYAQFLEGMTHGEFAREYRECMADADKARDPYTIIGPDYISVCANCFPGDSILKYFPDLAGCKISHGICTGHKRRFILALKMRRATPASAPVAVEQEVGAL